MTTLDRLERLWHRLEWEGRYTDANIIHLAIEEIKNSRCNVSRDGNVSLNALNPERKGSVMFKKILQYLGIIRGDLDQLLSFGGAFAQRLDAHANRASTDAVQHLDIADRHNSLADQAMDEARRAKKVAGNVRQMFAI